MADFFDGALLRAAVQDTLRAGLSTTTPEAESNEPPKAPTNQEELKNALRAAAKGKPVAKGLFASTHTKTCENVLATSTSNPRSAPLETTTTYSSLPLKRALKLVDKLGFEAAKAVLASGSAEDETIYVAKSKDFCVAKDSEELHLLENLRELTDVLNSYQEDDRNDASVAKRSWEMVRAPKPQPIGQGLLTCADENLQPKYGAPQDHLRPLSNKALEGPLFPTAEEVRSNEWKRDLTLDGDKITCAPHARATATERCAALPGNQCQSGGPTPFGSVDANECALLKGMCVSSEAASLGAEASSFRNTVGLVERSRQFLKTLEKVAESSDVQAVDRVFAQSVMANYTPSTVDTWQQWAQGELAKAEGNPAAQRWIAEYVRQCEELRNKIQEYYGHKRIKSNKEYRAQLKELDEMLLKERELAERARAAQLGKDFVGDPEFRALQRDKELDDLSGSSISRFSMSSQGISLSDDLLSSDDPFSDTLSDLLTAGDAESFLSNLSSVDADLRQLASEV